MQFLKNMPFLVAATFVLGVTVGAILASAQEPATSDQKEKILIQCLDGGDYEMYKPSLVTRVQEALKREGFCGGIEV